MKSCQYKSSDELPLILNVQEVSNFLGLGLSQVYELVKRIDFPAFKVCKQKRRTLSSIRSDKDGR